jgi:hypothetical protein
MVERTHYRPEEFRRMLGIGRTTFWKLVKSGKITVDRSFGFPLVPATCLPTCHPPVVSAKPERTTADATREQRLDPLKQYMLRRTDGNS